MPLAWKAWASVDGAGTQWLRIDLGAVQAVDRVKLSWEKAYARAYHIQSSVDGAFQLYKTSSSQAGPDRSRL